MNSTIYPENKLTEKEKAVDAYYWITQEANDLLRPSYPMIKCRGCGEVLQRYHPAIEYKEAWVNLKAHLEKTGFNDQHNYIVNLNQW